MSTAFKQKLWFWMFYAVLGFLIYGNSLDNSFVFDDYDFIVNNYNIRNILDIPSIWNVLSHPSRFIGFLSFALNFHFNQLNVFGYHFVNLIIHIVNAVLVFLLTDKILRIKPFSNHRIDVPIIAFVAGLVFLTHPLATQAVTYISQRFSSLATFFYLASIVCYLNYYSARIRKYFYFMLLFALLGMFTKQIVFTLPIMLILLDQVFFKEKKCFNILHLGLISLLLLIIPVCMSIGGSRIFSMTTLSGSHDGDVLNAYNYFLSQGRVVFFYLKLFFVPIGQSLDHDFKLSKTIFDMRVLGSFSLLIFIFVWGLKKFKSNPLITFCIIWFFLTISVTSSIIPIHHPIFEHRMYLPSVGLSILLSYLSVRYLDAGKMYIPLIMIIVLVFSILTVRRNVVWDNEILLWGDVVRKAPEKARGYRSLAVAFNNKDEFLKALQFIQKAITLYPSYLEAYETRGKIFYLMGDYANALLDFNYVLDKNPDHSVALKDRADLWMRKNNLDEALADYNKAIALNPNDPHIYNGRAQVYAKRKKFDAALNDINQAISIDAYQYEFYNNRGILYAMTNNPYKAIEDFHKSLSLNEKQPSVEKNLKTVQQLLDQNQ